MNEVFKIVYEFLKWISEITGFTYREVNIIVYFILIPFMFLGLLDKVLKVDYLKIGFAVLVLVALFFIPNFESFSNELFDKSVDFLNWFNIVGMNYIQASVVICVIIPIIILGILMYFNKRKLKR